MFNVFLDKIREVGCTTMIDAPLGSYSSLQIGGKAKLAVWPNSPEEVIRIIELAREYNIRHYVLGNCSNILVDDAGFDGVVILFGRSGHNFRDIHLIDDTTIYVESGVSLQELCQFAYGNSLSGMEFAFGIPAAIGGAIYMNSGAFDGEIKDVVTECTFIDENNQLVTFTNEQCQFSYRHSYFHEHHCIILSCIIKLVPGIKDDIKAKMNGFMQRRIASQPLNYPSAGSTFKRPGGAYAAKLIDDSGLKGYRIGGAMVSPKHAGFVINYEKASSQDMLDVIAHIQEVVKEKTGYSLEPEIIYIN